METRLDLLEIASGSPVGPARTAVESAPEIPSPGARSALQAAIRPALKLPRCLVAFSGGRDSSAILAVATQLARRENLPLPVPATYHFSDSPESEERVWQEQVLTHLHLDDWLRIPVDDELDFLGPHAQRFLTRHGVSHPSNTYLMSPLLERAGDGAVLTGTFGDQLFLGWRWQAAADVRARRSPALPGGWLRPALAHSPLPLRRWAAARRFDPARLPDWLTADAKSDLRRRLLNSQASEPADWRKWVTAYNCSRAWELQKAAVAALAADHPAVLVQPFGEPAVRRAIAIAGGRCGFADRSAGMRSLFGDLLPDALLSRSTKASFPLSRGETSAFRARWDGTGLPDGLVDADRLRATGNSYRTSYLWQWLWLATEAGDDRAVV